MSSYIFNFSRTGRALLCVLLLLVAVEAALRAGHSRLSRNMRDIAAIPDTARELGRSSERKILVVGNSLSRLGIDHGRLAAMLREQTGITHDVFGITPDMTTVCDWYYAVKNNFIRPGLLPDVLVISSFPYHFNDDQPVDSARLAKFAGLGDAPEIFRHDLHDFGSRLDFVLSRFLFLAGMRNEIRNLLEWIIPYYREGALQAHDALQAGRDEARSTGRAGFDRLARLLGIAAANGIRVIIAAMPPSTEPCSELREAVGRGGGVFIDMLERVLIDGSRYYDY